MKIQFKDYATQTIKKYAKIAEKYVESGGCVKINRIIFDFSMKRHPWFYAESQGAIYKFELVND